MPNIDPVQKQQLVDALMKAMQNKNVGPIKKNNPAPYPVPLVDNLNEVIYKYGTGAAACEQSGDLDFFCKNSCLVEETENTNMSSEQDIQEIKDSLVITTSRERTIVHVVVVDKSQRQNRPRTIPCNNGISFSGYSYDPQQDVYFISCVETRELGPIRCSVRVAVPNAGNWSTQVPLSLGMIEKLATPAQRQLIKEMRAKYSQDNYEIHFIQLKSCD